MRRLFVLTAAMAMVITSCKKYEVSEPLDLESLPIVKLKGNVYAQLDETMPSGTYELVKVKNLKVRVSIPYSAYDTNNTSGGYYVKEATIPADGKYEVEVPFVKKGVTATLTFMDFVYDVNVRNNLGEVRTVVKLFERVDKPVYDVGRNQAPGDCIEVIDVKYNAGVANTNNTVLGENEIHKVKVSGKLEYYAADTGSAPGDPQWKKVPDTKIVATITLTAPDGRTYKVIKEIPVTNGVYTINDVPMVTRGTAVVTLSGEDYWEFVDNDNKRAIYRHTLSTPPFTVYDYRDGTQEGKDYQYTRDIKMYDL